MRNKYKLIGGFNVSDNYEMRKLKKMASKGWILEDIALGMFYKFRKEKPHNLYYDIDYNSHADEKYFNKFKKSGWGKVLSIKDTMHIFSSKKENKVIFSDLKLDRDTVIQGIIARQIGLWFIANMIIFGLIGIMAFSKTLYQYLFLLLSFISIFTIVRFFASIMDYYVYHERIKAVKRYGNCDDSIGSHKAYFTINVIASIMFCIIALIETLHSGLYGVTWIILCGFGVLSSTQHYKKYKKGLNSISR